MRRSALGIGIAVDESEWHVAGDLIPALVGAAAGVVTALATGMFARRRTAGEAERAFAEAAKARAEAREIDARVASAQEETAQLKSAVDNAQASIAYDRAQRSLTVFSSLEDGFSPFDFKLEVWDGADAELLFPPEDRLLDPLVLVRRRSDGLSYLWIMRYGYRDQPDVIPVAGTTGRQRMIRVQCEIRSRGAARTVLFVLKDLSAPMGQHLGSRRFRLESEAWKRVDAVFTVWPNGDARLRIEDRSVTAAPSRLEVRNLTVVEREAPSEVSAR